MLKIITWKYLFSLINILMCKSYFLHHLDYIVNFAVYGCNYIYFISLAQVCMELGRKTESTLIVSDAS